MVAPPSYSELVMSTPAILVLKLDTSEPIELSAFVGAFTALEREYARFISERLPGSPTESQIFVKEVRQGCIEADLLPALAPLLASADNVLVLEDFVRRWGGRLRALIEKKVGEGPQTQSDLKTWADAVVAVANDPDGSATISAAEYVDGKREVRASIRFDTSDARLAQTAIAERRLALSKPDDKPLTRVLMRFTRSDIGTAAIGKRSGERVRVDAVTDKPLALMYGSDLAEEQIKHEIREADENVYKRGFVVDVYVQNQNGKPAAYSVTHLHSVIDLDETED